VGLLYQHNYFEIYGAQERIRTSTSLRTLDPESSASASSATWALPMVKRGEFIVLGVCVFVNAERRALGDRNSAPISESPLFKEVMKK
jgi:hypothetical protein